ncbi:MAG: isocitrate/isopropylmalate family dehydrogenase, partial [Burkholderiaceae bacterium]
MSKLRIAVLPGDGIGVDVVAAAAQVIKRVEARMPGAALDLEHHEAGAAHYQKSGESLPAAALKACEDADAILLGAMGMPDVRYKDGTEIAPQLDIRDHFQLYAGVRPIRALPGLPLVLSNPKSAGIDMVLV